LSIYFIQNIIYLIDMFIVFCILFYRLTKKILIRLLRSYPFKNGLFESALPWKRFFWGFNNLVLDVAVNGWTGKVLRVEPFTGVVNAKQLDKVFTEPSHSGALTMYWCSTGPFPIIRKRG
jgi:hypothetical protein